MKLKKQYQENDYCYKSFPDQIRYLLPNFPALLYTLSLRVAFYS